MSKRSIPQQLALFCLICMVFLFLIVVAHANRDTQRVGTPMLHGNSFSVYILSRGKGVPEEARTSFDNIYRELVTLEQSGNVIYLKKERIGLEGEKKLCVEFADSENARTMFSRIHTLAVDIDLFKIVSESCSR